MARLIIIEDRIYKISEQQYKELEKQQKDEEDNHNPTSMVELIEKKVNDYEFLGFVDFHWRL